MNSLKLLSIFLASLWFAACVTTGTTKKTQSQEEKSRQTSQESQTSASKPESGKEQGASEKSSSSQTTSQKTTKENQQQAAEKAKPGQPAAGAQNTPDTEKESEKSQSPKAGSEPAAGSQQKAAEKSPSSRQPASRQTADSKLEEARKNLRISEATEKRIASELEQLKQSGTASAETIKNYEIYHDSVRQMVAENRKIVEQMEAAKARHSSDSDSNETAARGNRDDMLDPTIPEEQTRDEVAALDRQLNASLNEFDSKLLKEMDEIREESSTKMRDLAQEAAEAAKRLRAKGVDVNTAGSESSDASSESEGQSSEQTQAEQGAEGTQTASSETSRAGGKGSGSGQRGGASSEDDDIVARQLREAAENETDPELKEKLWKEYDEYKNSQR